MTLILVRLPTSLSCLAYSLIIVLLLHHGYRVLSFSFFSFPYRKYKVEAQVGTDRPLLTVTEFPPAHQNGFADCALGKMNWNAK